MPSDSECCLGRGRECAQSLGNINNRVFVFLLPLEVNFQMSPARMQIHLGLDPPWGPKVGLKRQRGYQLQNRINAVAGFSLSADYLFVGLQWRCDFHTFPLKMLTP